MFSTFPPSRFRMWSRKIGPAVPYRVSLLILHAQAESGAYSRDSSRLPRCRSSIPSTDSGSVLSLSGYAIACRWRSLPRVHADVGPRVFKVVRVMGAAVFSGITMGQRLFFPTPAIGTCSGHDIVRYRKYRRHIPLSVQQTDLPLTFYGVSSVPGLGSIVEFRLTKKMVSPYFYIVGNKKSRTEA